MIGAISVVFRVLMHLIRHPAVQAIGTAVITAAGEEILKAAAGHLDYRRSQLGNKNAAIQRKVREGKI